MSTKERFDELAREMLKKQMSHDPLTATYLGCHDYDALLPTPAPEGDRLSLQLLRESLDKLKGLDREQLDGGRLLDLDLLEWTTELSAFYLEEVKRYRLGGCPVEYFSGSLHPLFAREFAPLEERVKSITGRLSAMSQFLELSKPAYEEPVAIFVEEHIAGCPAACEFIETIVNTVSAQIPANLAAELKKEAKAAQEKLMDFHKWLKTDVMPRSGMNYGLGKENFAQMIATRRLGLTLEEVRQLGEESFAQLDEACRQEAEKIAPGKGIEGARQSLREEKFGSFDDILQAYREAIELARKVVQDSGFASLPQNDALSVEPTPPHLAISTPAAAYFPPEPLGPPPPLGIYVVTEPSSESQLAEHYRASIINVSFHEAYPGHHLQALRALEHPSPIRLLVNGIEFVEGWAHYCEEEMYKLSPQSHRGLRLAQLLDARYRALRIVLDVGLHCGDISYEEGQRLMVEKLGAAPETARAEVCWYCREPGYAMSYLLGKILFQRLRAKAEKMMGDKFKARDFHDRILYQGNLPMWALERVISEEYGESSK